VIAHKKTQEMAASTGSGGVLLVLALLGFVGAVALVASHSYGAPWLPVWYSGCS
jgi:hypothetical protein